MVYKKSQDLSKHQNEKSQKPNEGRMILLAATFFASFFSSFFLVVYYPANPSASDTAKMFIWICFSVRSNRTANSAFSAALFAFARF